VIMMWASGPGRGHPRRSTEYDLWLDAFGFACRNARLERIQECPSCGERRLRLLFLVDEPGCVRGMAVFWCDGCLRGLMPLMSVVPVGAQTVVRGGESIPNFSIVAVE
jgi:hypothetical protein